MIDINFDNPYYLLFAIPLLALVLVPYFIAVRKDNRTKGVVASLLLHLLIVVCVTLGIAGTEVTRVITETEVYVVADVSYSSNKNLRKIDEYIDKVEAELPRNGKLGVVCFGKDSQLFTPLGEERESVKKANVDESATDITQALDYTATLFSEGAVKRIVLISDGKQTDTENTAKLIRAVESLYSQNVYIDAMYLDNNVTGEETEVQISGVNYTASTYRNHLSTADALVRTSYETEAVVSLYKNGQKLADKAERLTQGLNVVNFDLDTSEAGAFDYELKIAADGDSFAMDDSYAFTQTVNPALNVLLISDKKADETVVRNMYGETATIKSYIKTKLVPCTVEELCVYDEIVLSNVDVRSIENYTSFVDGIDTVVSQFGKSLVTLGDLKIQNKSDEILKQLEDILPVNFGNANRDAKLVGIALDASNSMEFAGNFLMAKQAAIQLLDLLTEQDWITVTVFAGNVYPIVQPTQLTDYVREDIINKINALPAEHGTCIGAGMEKISSDMLRYSGQFQDMQIMLISDGRSYMGETGGLDAPVQTARNLLANGIATSTIVTTARETDAGFSVMGDIAAAGGGKAYWAKDVETLEELILTEVADDFTEAVIEKVSPVKIKRRYDDTVDGVDTLENVNGYFNNKAKSGATTVLTVPYEKDNGGVVEVPLYAYWKYGNGNVATFASDIGNAAWTGDFLADDNGNRFMQNVLATNVPAACVDDPYTLEVTTDGAYASISLTPVTINPKATATVEITTADGTVITAGQAGEDSTAIPLTFDSTRYFYKFATSELGKYTVKVTYSYSDKTFETTEYFHIVYYPEYDKFAAFDAYDLYSVIRNRGTVSEDGTITLEENPDEISTYTVNLVAPCLIITVAAFVMDIAVRKLKWSDIKGLFKRKPKAGKGGSL